MKHFDKLSAENLQGATFKHDLAAVTTFAGRNWSGKTTRLNAFMLAAAGYVPGLNETSSGIFEQFATGNPLGVGIGNGVQGVFRSWEQKKGSVKYHGQDVALMSRVAVDAMEYLNLSGPQRVKFLFKCVKMPDKFANARAVHETVVANVKNIKLEPHTKEAEAAITELICSLSNYTQVNGSYKTSQEWIEEVAELILERKKAAVTNEQRMSKTGQGLTQVGGQDDPAPPDAESKLLQAREALATAERECATLAEQLRQMRDEYKVVKAKSEAGGKDVSALAAESAQLQANPITVLAPPIRTVIAGTFEKCRKEFEEAKTIHHNLGIDVKRLEVELEAARISGGKCEHCHQSLAPVKKKLVPQLEKKLEQRKQLLKASAKGVEELNVAHDTTKTALEDCDKLIQDRNALLEQESKRVARISEITTQLSAVSGVAAASQRVTELTTLGQSLAPKHLEAQNKVAACKAVVSSAENQYNKLLAERAAEKQRAHAAEEQLRAAAEAAVLKEAVKMMADLQAELVNAAVGPIVTTANRLLGAVLPYPLVYQAGEFRLHNKAPTHKLMSGTEKTLVYAALSVALAQESPCKVVIMDEFDIDAQNWEALLKHLCLLQREGVIDQALLAHTTAPTLTEPNFRCVSL